MTATLIDGKAVAQRIYDELKLKVQRIHDTAGIVPGLATILVGSDPASQTYVGMKQRRCATVGMKSFGLELPASINTAKLLGEIDKLNQDMQVHGILLQHPVPSHIDERAAFEAIAPSKDVDGVTATSFGSMGFGMPAYGACTPAGIMLLLKQYQVPLEGCRAVVIGRSAILGKPMALMLLNANATVTICHSKTKHLPELVREADLVVAAVGKPRFVQGDWIKPGAVVIDAGYTQGNIGDVDFEPAAQRAAMITPIPGGVGPMTIAVLLQQTVESAAKSLHVKL